LWISLLYRLVERRLGGLDPLSASLAHLERARGSPLRLPHHVHCARPMSRIKETDHCVPLTRFLPESCACMASETVNAPAGLRVPDRPEGEDGAATVAGQA
jgi:hypothetical protein